MSAEQLATVPFTIRRATRQNVRPLIGFYGESGCGKTYSALLCARGIVGQAGKIGMVDTESGRGELYADVLPGGYDVLQLDPPYHPARCGDAVYAMIDSGAEIIVYDSASHEWEGAGGVLEMAGDNEARTGKPGLHCWKTPKLEHQKLMLRLLQSPVPIIVCLRAKYKSRQVKNERGKNEIVKDDHTSPIQAEDFIYEMTAHGEILQDHSIHLTKCSHPDLRGCFPTNGPITIEHGEAIASWARGGAAADKKTVAPSIVASLKKELWNLLKSEHGNNRERFDAILLERELIDHNEYPADLSAQRLAEIIAKVKESQ